MGTLGQEAALSRRHEFAIGAILLGMTCSLAFGQGECDPPAPGPQTSDQESTPRREAPQGLPERPPRPRAIQGIASVYSRSRLAFPADPDQAFECEATFVFPDRARWRIARVAKPDPDRPGASARNEDPGSRSIRFRWGQGLWLLDHGKHVSVPFEDDGRHEVLMQLELRRIAMIWPGELKWTEGLEVRTADLPELGSVKAYVDPKSGRPTRLESFDADGSLRERLDEIKWRQDGERFWPSEWKLVFKEQVAWHETFEEVKSGVKYPETYFIPVDRRGGTSSSNSTLLESVQPLVLAAACVRRFELDAEERKDWKRALAAGERALGEWRTKLAKLSLELDARPTFLLDEKGMPTALELELSSLPEKLPEGWGRRAETRGLRLVTSGTSGLRPHSIQKLRAALPEGEKGGTPYAKVQLAAHGAGIIQICLPIAARD